jgi:Lysozyme like domain
MTTYTYAQLESIWINNGGSKTVAPIAAAIAMAESGGDSEATDNDSNGTTDRGLWQINSLWGGLSSYDVDTNAKAAIKISNNGGDWNPWTTFTSGAYRKFLSSVSPEAVTAAQQNVTGSGSPAPPGQSGSTGLIGDIENILGITAAKSAATDLSALVSGALWLFNPGHWFRIGSFFTGAVLLGFGIFLLAKAANPDLHLPSTPPVMPIPIPV